MNSTYYLLGWVAIFILLAGLVGRQLHRLALQTAQERHQRRELSLLEEISSLHTAELNLANDMDNMVRSLVKSGEDLQAALTAEYDTAKLEIQRLNKRYEGLFSEVESICQERDSWRQHYYRQAIEHGNAQAMMMGVIEQLSYQASRAGVVYEMPPIIRAVQQEFQERHIQPAVSGIRAMSEQCPPVEQNKLDTEKS